MEIKHPGRETNIQHNLKSTAAPGIEGNTTLQEKKLGAFQVFYHS